MSQVCLHSDDFSTGACPAVSAATVTLVFAVALEVFAAGFVFTAVLAAAAVLEPAFDFETDFLVAVAGFCVANGRSSQRLTPPGLGGGPDISSVRAASGTKKEARQLTQGAWGQLPTIPVLTP